MQTDEFLSTADVAWLALEDMRSNLTKVRGELAERLHTIDTLIAQADALLYDIRQGWGDGHKITDGD